MMLSDEQIKQLRGKIMTLVIIAAALVNGALVFAFIVGAVTDWTDVNRPLKIFNLIAAGTALLMYVLAFLVPTLFPKAPEKVPAAAGGIPTSDPDEDKLRAALEVLSLLTNETVIRFALLEGGILLNVMVCMLEPRWISVGAAGLGFLLMLICFPFPGRVVRSIEDRLDLRR